MLLTGSLMEAPPEAGVLLTGAVCVTMHPENVQGTTVIASASGPANATIGGVKDMPQPSGPAAPPKGPASSDKSWALWFFDLFFKK